PHCPVTTPQRDGRWRWRVNREREETTMFTTQDKTQPAERPAKERLSVEAVIAEGVLHRLGEPNNLHKVQVKPVYGDKYRVNVYVRADAASYRVAHSYLVSADGEGKVLASSPDIARTY